MMWGLHKALVVSHATARVHHAAWRRGGNEHFATCGACLEAPEVERGNRYSALRMTAKGQSRRFGDVRASSALALKADIHHKARHVSKVPCADIHHYSAQSLRPSVNTIRYSPLSILREYVVAVLHHRVAREPALRVVFLRRSVRCSGGLKRIGRRVIVELAPSPSAAVREPLAVLHHETNVLLGTWHRWRTGVRLLYFRVPMNFRHLGAVWERLAIAGHAFLIGVDHYRIPYDHSDLASVLTDRDHWPVLVSPKLREREAIRHLHSVFVLRGNRDTSRQNGDRYRNTETDQRAFFHCRISLVGLAAGVGAASVCA